MVSNTANYHGVGLLFDITPWAQLASTPASFMNTINQDFFGGRMSAPIGAAISNAMSAAGDPNTAAQIGLFLAATSADFQLVK